MLPFIVLGLVAGASYALASVGIVLTYRTTGFFNFAYGGIAMFLAYVFWQLRDQWGLSQWISIPLLLLVAAPILGLILERLFRTMASRTADVQLVVAVGMLAFFTALVPIIFGNDQHQLPTIFPPTRSVTIAGTVITATQLGTVALALAAGALLYLLLRWTRFGTATRAVVDNRDLSGLIGINANQVGQVAWIIATMFAALSGVLLSIENNLVTYVLPFLVIYSFAPAVLARLTSLPVAYAGAFALGVLIDVLQKYSLSDFKANLVAQIPNLLLFLLLIVLGKRLVELRSSVRTLTGAHVIGNHTRRTAVTGLAAAVIGAVAIPQLFAASTVHDIAEAMAYAVVALTVVVLTGWTGQVSLAQMSFAGIGAFTAAHVAGTHGGLFPLAMLDGVLIAVPVSLVIGFLSLRLSGLFFALSTLAFAMLMDGLIFALKSVTGGITGLNLTAAKIGPLTFESPNSQFYLCGAVLVLAGFGAVWLRQGPIGRRLQMVRDAPEAASTLGANLTLTTIAVFAGCTAVASIGGSLLAVTQATVDPSNFTSQTSLALLLAVVLGGRSLISGAVFAGGVQLVQLLPLDANVHKYLPLGVALSVIMVAQEPDGLPRVSVQQLKYCSAILYRRSIRNWLRLPAGGGRATPSVASGRSAEPAPLVGGGRA
ncbi:MAG TPA: ABC transporter permease [Mycobacteriales bacterium]|nr:ABC transporter permease [Mycobacteriales bacterium]